MKFTPNDFSILSGAIKRFLHLYTPEEIEGSRTAFHKVSKAVDKDLAFRWAVFYKVRKNDQTVNDMIAERKYNDAHIETALKRIFKEYGVAV